MIKAVLPGIEGTTSALSFVKDVLFPYSRARLADFVRATPRSRPSARGSGPRALSPTGPLTTRH